MKTIANRETIALFVLLEKTMPDGDWMSRFSGVLLVLWGVANLVRMA
jgi:predicted metal-binding membrane protein